MTDLRVITAEGSDAILEEAAVADFAAGLRGPLRELLGLHYRCRFDPDGVADREKQLLAQGTDSVLARLSQNHESLKA